jgi:hypothetical protein
MRHPLPYGRGSESPLLRSFTSMSRTPSPYQRASRKAFDVLLNERNSRDDPLVRSLRASVSVSYLPGRPKAKTRAS